jgi:hypothetical protein
MKKTISIFGVIGMVLFSLIVLFTSPVFAWEQPSLQDFVSTPLQRQLRSQQHQVIPQDNTSQDRNDQLRQQTEQKKRQKQYQQQGFGHSWDNKNIYMQTYKHNAYGPGVHSDTTGKPFEWKTHDGQTSHSNKVKPDGYGLGVGMDEYGRPVKPSPWGQ